MTKKSRCENAAGWWERQQHQRLRENSHKRQIEKYAMDLATQRSLVTLANFNVSDQVTPLFKTLKASHGPPGKVASTPASPLITARQSPPGSSLAELLAWTDVRFFLAPVLFPLPGTFSSFQTPICPY